jgi:competence protein ComEA
MKSPLHNIFSPGEQRILLFLIFSLFTGIGLQLSGKDQLAQVSPADSLTQALEVDYQLRIDIRTASEEELMALKGIGPKRAKDIIAFRDMHPFQNVNDLLQVSGIGPKTYQKLLPDLLVFGDSLGTQTQPGSASSSAKPTTGTVNINSASLDELCALDGIGPKKARAIIDYREANGQFTSPDDLCQVKGIGKITLEKNRARIAL